MKEDQLKHAIEEASTLAKFAPDDYRKETFQVILGNLLAHEVPVSGNKAVTTPLSGQRSLPNNEYRSREEMLDAILSTDVDFSTYDSLIEKGTWVDKTLLILKIAEDQFGVKGLTTNELIKVMKDKLRLSEVSPSNLSRDLANSKKTLLRSKEGRGFKYSLTRTGVEYLTDLIEKYDQMDKKERK